MIETATEGRVRRVVLNRPEKRNALNARLCRELARAFDDAQEDDGVGAILLCAKGSSFCAGMDLSEASHGNAEALNQLHEGVFTLIERMRKPVIAAVEGDALGGGAGLVANAHIAIASPGARFGLTEIRVALWPVLIMRAVVLAVGERRATELSLTGRIFDADAAREYGLVSEVAENALERASETAQMCSRRSASAMSVGLSYARSIRGSDWEAAGRAGSKVREELLGSAEFRTAAQAFLTRSK